LRGERDMPEWHQEIGHELQVGQIVFNYEDARGHESFLAQDQREPAAFAKLALQCDFPRQQLGQLLAEVQTQAGSLSAPPAGCANLREGLEKLCLVLGPDTEACISDGDLGERLSAIAM